MQFRNLFLWLRKFDWILFAAVALLIFFGLSALYSVAISSTTPNLANFGKQAIFASLGLLLVFVISLIDYHYWQQLGWFFYLASIILLLAVLFFGKTVSGTTGWFVLSGFNFQPVELAKVALVIILADFLAGKGTEIKTLKNYLLSGLLAAVPFGLVMLQPDFGSAIMLFWLWLMMMFFARAKRRHLIVTALVILLGLAVAWLVVFQPYQRDRVLTFFNPSADPYGRGYQVRQAIVAIGAGGLFGRGLGFGSQSQLKFIPASQTDFIFAVVGEELGFLGIGLILFFWGLIFYRFKKIISQSTDDFATLFLLGISALFFGQLFINIGMNIGLVPVTGIPLPFISYGGSFLLVSLAAIGLVESIILHYHGRN